MNIAQLLTERAAEHADDVAIIEWPEGVEQRLTFEQLNEQSARMAELLKQKGLTSGDRMLVFVPMSSELYVAMIAAFRMGVVAMFLDPSAGREHIDRCCEIGKPKAIVATSRAHMLRIMSPAIRRIKHRFHVGRWVPGSTAIALPLTGDANETIVEVDDDAPALLTFTSGSTGEPKATARSNGFLMAQLRVLQASLNLQHGQRDLATLPIFALANLGSGVATLIPSADLIRPGRVDADSIVSQIQQAQPTRSAGSPAFFECIADYCSGHSITLESFESIYTGGAPVFPGLLTKLKRIAPNANIHAVYGSTEAEPIAQISQRDITEHDVRQMLDGRGLLTGQPESCIDLRIIHDRWGQPIGPFKRVDFENLTCAGIEPGEIVVTGDHVLNGYVDGRGDEETKFEVEDKVWHRTGDAGYLDETGRLWLLGRCEAKIDDERGELYPFAVECAASHRDDVRRAAVVLIGGKRILAIETDMADAADSIERSLAWANVDDVRVFNALPVDKRHNAKIDYPKLRAMIESTSSITSSGRRPLRK